MQPLETVKVRALAHEKPRIEMREVTETVRDLLQPNPRIYWSDLLVFSALGWSSFAFYLFADSALNQAGFFILSVLFLYRALFFIHEISHHSSKTLPGFNLGWNLLIGIPMMVPSFLYETVHLDHHRRHKYGTLEDPEYLPLGKGSRWDIVIFLGKTFLFPVVLAMRALILAPVGLLIPPFHKWLEINLSALVINESYKRSEPSEFERSRMKMIELATLILWAGIVMLYVRGELPVHFFGQWYVLIFAIGFINQTRTLAAHRYNNEGHEMEYEEQLQDSINVEGGFFTELWAPVGARYHALHHYIPKLPYHSLPEAHRRMKLAFSDNPLYLEVNEKSFMSAFKKLWKVVAIIFLLSAQLNSPAQASDPCVQRISTSIQKHENMSVVKTGLKNVTSLVEVDQDSFLKSRTRLLFGRFFQTDVNSNKIVFWMIPYAQGKACILRDVKTL